MSKSSQLILSELIVIGYYRTPLVESRIQTGELSPHYVSSLICWTVDQQDLKITVKREQDLIPTIGSIIEIKYSDLTVTGLPKFPVLLGVREDKTVDADTLDKFIVIRSTLNLYPQPEETKTMSTVALTKKPTLITTGKQKRTYTVSPEQVILLQKNRNYAGTFTYDDLYDMKQDIRTEWPIRSGD